MYSLEYLPLARQDMIDIVLYISDKLENPVAAQRLADRIIKATDSLKEFPYANPAYNAIRPLKNEYRRLLVKNYAVFYCVDEEKKQITIARVVYARRNFETLLK